MRRFSVTILASFAALFAQPSFADRGTLKRECNAHFCGLFFDGEIRIGDAKRIERAIETSPLVIEDMVISSPGGNPFEAMKISAVLNKYYVALIAGFRNGTGERVQGIGGDCASACAVMWITADQRSGTEIFLHRPTFPAELFSSMSGTQAQAVYQTMTDDLVGELHKRSVPDSLIEQMMRIPSDNLSRIDAGFPNQSAWMQEWLTAKCGSTNAAFIAGVIGSKWDAAGANFRCISEAIEAAQRDTQHKPQ